MKSSVRAAAKPAPAQSNQAHTPASSAPTAKIRGMATGWKVGIGIIALIVVIAIIDGSNSGNNPNTNSDAMQQQAVSPQTPLPTVPSQLPDYGNSNAQSNESNNPPAPVDTQNSSIITANDVAPYLTAVGQVECYRYGQLYDTGSGSVWQFSDSQNTYVITNEHVIKGDSYCKFLVLPTGNDPTSGFYDLDISSPMEWNTTTDAAAVLMTSVDDSWASSTPISDLNDSVASLRDCQTSMPQESPVAIVGFPASTQNSGPTMTVTNGVISGYDNSNPDKYSDYYVSAQVDNGNSGGVALSKDSSGVCLLGIPTWVSIGQQQVEGDVQDINNIFYSGTSSQ